MISALKNELKIKLLPLILKQDYAIKNKYLHANKNFFDFLF